MSSIVCFRKDFSVHILGYCDMLYWHPLFDLFWTYVLAVTDSFEYSVIVFLYPLVSFNSFIYCISKRRTVIVYQFLLFVFVRFVDDVLSGRLGHRI